MLKLIKKLIKRLSRKKSDIIVTYKNGKVRKFKSWERATQYMLH